MYQDMQQDVQLDSKGRAKKISQRMMNAKYLMLQARHWRRNLLFHMHALTFDREFEKLLFISSKGTARKVQLQFNPSGEVEEVNHEAVPVKSVKWAMDVLTKADYNGAFVDVQAGRGNRLLIAAARPFEKIIGIENSNALRDGARMNIAQFPRSFMRCRQVECLDLDAANIPVPEGRVTYFFYKPRHMGDLQTQINRIAGEYKKNPRRFHILTLGASPQVEEMIFECGVFETTSYPLLARMKHRILSPHRIRAYRTLV